MFTRTKNEMLPKLSQSKENLSSLQKNFRSRLMFFKQNRTSSEQNTLINDFNQVLIVWGIEASKIPTVIHELRLRCLILLTTIFMLIPLAFSLQSVHVYFSFILILVPCVLCFFTTLWRISILKHRRFVSFFGWLFSLLSFR